MKMFGLQFGVPTSEDLARFRVAQPTYDHVGSTLGAQPPGDVRRYESSVTVGTGEAVLRTGRDALRSWVPQRSLGASITPADVAPDRDETVVLGIGVGPMRLVVPTRIVTVVDEPDRFGYAYGTLPGHPEQGEELFILEMLDDGEVVFTVRADAGPASQLRWLQPAMSPVVRSATRRYTASVVRALR